MENGVGSNPTHLGSYPSPPAIYVAEIDGELIEVDEDWWPCDPVSGRVQIHDDI